MSKVNKTTILIIALSISILFNVVLVVRGGVSIGKNLTGIYQAQYFNKYDHSMTVTLKLYEEGKCKIGDYATEYSHLEDDCTWVKNNNTIEVTGKNNRKTLIQILPSGNLLYENRELKKIG